MARLTSSYSAVMGAVGALYRVSREICNEIAVIGDEVNSGDAASVEDKMEAKSANEVKIDANKDMNQDTTSNEMQTDDENTSDAIKDNASNKLEESKEAIRKVAQSVRTPLPLYKPESIFSPKLSTNRQANEQQA